MPTSIFFCWILATSTLLIHEMDSTLLAPRNRGTYLGRYCFVSLPHHSQRDTRHDARLVTGPSEIRNNKNPTLVSLRHLVTYSSLYIFMTRIRHYHFGVRPAQHSSSDTRHLVNTQTTFLLLSLSILEFIPCTLGTHSPMLCCKQLVAASVV